MVEMLASVGGSVTMATILLLIFRNNHKVIMTLIKNHNEAMKNITDVLNDFNHGFIVHDERVKSFIDTYKEKMQDGHSFRQ